MIHWSINIYNLCLVQLISKTQQLKFQSFQHFVHSMKFLSDSSHLGWRGSFIFHLNREPFNNYPRYICQVVVISWMKIFICIFFCIIYKLKNSNKQMAKFKNLNKRNIFNSFQCKIYMFWWFKDTFFLLIEAIFVWRKLKCDMLVTTHNWW